MAGKKKEIPQKELNLIKKHSLVLAKYFAVMGWTYHNEYVSPSSAEIERVLLSLRRDCPKKKGNRISTGRFMVEYHEHFGYQYFLELN